MSLYVAVRVIALLVMVTAVFEAVTFSYPSHQARALTGVNFSLVPGQTLGIVGLGRIGTATALRAKAFGFRVVFFDPYVPSGVHKAVGIERVASLAELLKISDTISIHCPSTHETRGLIGAPEIAQMKPTSFLVNTARGDIVQKGPLFAALREGRLAGAGLDVVENEPLRTTEEATTPHLIVTCHAAFCSPEGMVEMRSTSARIARAAVTGLPVWNRVN